MPIYQYQPIEDQTGCKFCKDGFELMQCMKDEPLAKCTHCGIAIRRIITATNINTKIKSTKSMMSDKNLKRLGFTKLVKEGKGKYRKTV